MATRPKVKTIDRFTWWRTPVWVFNTELPTEFNDAVIKEIVSIGDEIASDPNPRNSLFDYSRPNFDFLKSVITYTATQELHKDIVEAKELNIALKPVMGWVNVLGKGESIEAHAHNDASLVATYYLKAPPFCGDLVYLDGSEMINADGAFSTDRTRLQRVTPEAGALVIMPAYCLHEVQPNKSDGLRVSISVDLAQVIDVQAPNALVIKSWVNSIKRLRG